jgi:lipopolysaccharide export system permease protein
MNNIYFRDTPNRTVTIQYYDADLKIGNAVAIEDYTSDTHPRLLQRIEARQMIWDSVVRDWRLKTAIERKFDGFRVNSVVVNEMPIQLNITNAKILELKKQPDEMTYDELWRYLMLLQQGGKNIRRQLIEYYGNFAFPFANLIVILFGVPFASVRRKGGLAIQIGAAMTISFLYLVFTKISQTIGFSMDLNPILVGWMANIVFIMLALFVLNKSRT